MESGGWLDAKGRKDAKRPFEVFRAGGKCTLLSLNALGAAIGCNHRGDGPLGIEKYTRTQLKKLPRLSREKGEKEGRGHGLDLSLAGCTAEQHQNQSCGCRAVDRCLQRRAAL